MYSIRIDIRPKSIVYSIRMKIKPKSIVYSIKMEAREDQGVREVIPHIGPITIIIPLKLFLDLPRDPVFLRGLSDSQSYAMNFTHVDSCADSQQTFYGRMRDYSICI